MLADRRVNFCFGVFIGLGITFVIAAFISYPTAHEKIIEGTCTITNKTRHYQYFPETAWHDADTLCIPLFCVDFYSKDQGENLEDVGAVVGIDITYVSNTTCDITYQTFLIGHNYSCIHGKQPLICGEVWSNSLGPDSVVFIFGKKGSILGYFIALLIIGVISISIAVGCCFIVYCR
jgi:hypothetical protein